MEKVSRRSMFAAIGAAGAGICACIMSEGCATFTKKGRTPAIPPGAYAVEGNTIKVALDKVPELAKAGGAVKIIDARLPTSVILARTGDRDYAAASLLCPHRGVEVEYRPEQREFRCASLGHSKFCEDGSLKKGLARKGLTHYDAKLDPSHANSLFVTF